MNISPEEFDVLREVIPLVARRAACEADYSSHVPTTLGPAPATVEGYCPMGVVLLTLGYGDKARPYTMDVAVRLCLNPGKFGAFVRQVARFTYWFDEGELLGERLCGVLLGEEERRGE